jgi:hypothetical protein
MCRQLWGTPLALLSVAMLTLALDGPSLAEIALAHRTKSRSTSW